MVLISLLPIESEDTIDRPSGEVDAAGGTKAFRTATAAFSQTYQAERG